MVCGLPGPHYPCKGQSSRFRRRTHTSAAGAGRGGCPGDARRGARCPRGAGTARYLLAFSFRICKHCAPFCKEGFEIYFVFSPSLMIFYRTRRSFARSRTAAPSPSARFRGELRGVATAAAAAAPRPRGHGYVGPGIPQPAAERENRYMLIVVLPPKFENSRTLV